MKHILIYDFDGTLTPHSSSDYPFLKENGTPESEVIPQCIQMVQETDMSIHEAYLTCCLNVLKNADVPWNIDSLCVHAENTVFNPGVFEFFDETMNDNYEHIILSAGFAEYIRRTKISQYPFDIWGTEMTFHEDGTYDCLMIESEKKPEILELIHEQLGCDYSQMVYLGDGMTDQFAFEYLHAKGGTSILLENHTNPHVIARLKDLPCIDHLFFADYSKGTPLYQFLTSLK